MKRSYPVGQAGKLTDELALRASTILAKVYKQQENSLTMPLSA